MGDLGNVIGLSAIYNQQSLAMQLGLQQQMPLAGAYGIAGSYTAGSSVFSGAPDCYYQRDPARDAVVKRPNSEWLDMRVNEMRVRL